jgi:hypothetical protein
MSHNDAKHPPKNKRNYKSKKYDKKNEKNIEKKTELITNSRWSLDNNDKPKHNERPRDDRHDRPRNDRPRDVRHDRPYNNRNHDEYNRRHYSHSNNNKYNKSNSTEKKEIVIVPDTTDAAPIDSKWKDACNKRIEETVSIHVPDGWYAINYDKQKKITYTNNGVDFYNSFDEMYTPEELAEKNKKEDDALLARTEYYIDKLRERDAQRSYEYYLETGDHDVYAIVEKEAIEYEKYLKNLEEECKKDDEESEVTDDIDDEYYDDN